MYVCVRVCVCVSACVRVYVYVYVCVWYHISYIMLQHWHKVKRIYASVLAGSKQLVAW